MQSQGRSNRYGQVARPRVVSVVTGLTPELRILQQRNCKLRMMGASVDGNRSHPLISDEVPDFLNVVGDQATLHVLEDHPDYARRLGFAEYIRKSGMMLPDAGQGHRAGRDSGSSRTAIQSLANRVLCRSLVLSASEQTELVTLIQMEFEAIVEELDSRNANPLRPKEIQGEIDLRATTIFSGNEEFGDIEQSAFMAPLYMSTGLHQYSETPIDSEQLVRLVNRSRITDSAEELLHRAEVVENQLPSLLSDVLPTNTSLETALEHPEQQPARFRQRLAKYRRLINLLRRIRPGRSIQIHNHFDEVADLSGTIVKIMTKELRFAASPQSYSIKIVWPGRSVPERMSLQRLVQIPHTDIQFGDGLEHGPNQSHLRQFTRQSGIVRRHPVQVLTGNHLAAITEAKRHNLGAMSLFRDTTGQVHRGIVVDRSKVDLSVLPIVIPSQEVAAELAIEILDAQTGRRSLSMWVGDRQSSVIYLTFYSPMKNRSGRVRLNAMWLRKSTLEFYSRFPLLFEAIFGQPLPDRFIGFRGSYRTTLLWPEEKVKIRTLLASLDGLTLQTDGRHRDAVYRLARELNKRKRNLAA